MRRTLQRITTPVAGKSRFLAGVTASLILVNWVLPGATARAQDTVVTRNKDSEETSNRRGEIVAWEGAALSLKGGTRTREIDNDRIVRIETNWPAEYVTAKRHLVNRKYSEAIPDFRAALAKERRDWAKTIIHAELVKAYLATEQTVAAIQEFGSIVAHDPHTRFMYLIPLAWAGTVGQANVKNQTQDWLTSTDPVVQLIGASWHVGGSQRTAAINALTKLSHNADPQVAHLAVAQLWRTGLTNVDGEQIEKWKQRIEQMPNELKAGPYYLLGSAQAKLKMTDDAAINWMRIPILYSDHVQLSAAALYKCGKLMRDEQRIEEAKTIWMELLRDYPNTAWASQIDKNFLPSSQK